jgi:transposase InsO family protein
MATAGAQQDERELVEQCFIDLRSNGGTRPIKARLHSEHRVQMSRRKIARYLRELGLCVKRHKRFINRDVTEKTHPAIAPNRLNRRFEVSHPNHVWASDITYIMSAEGWQFLCVFIDLYSRQIVGWAMDKHMRSEWVETALKRALWARKPAKGLMVHTDQGSQFVSQSYRGLLKAWGIRQSMSRRGNCWDNAVTESFFKTLKDECVYRKRRVCQRRR